jgi:hypothetical protein
MPLKRGVRFANLFAEEQWDGPSIVDRSVGRIRFLKVM